LEKVKLWALSQAFENKIVESWVIELLEELVEIIPIEKIALHCHYWWPNFRFYLDYSLSLKARAALAYALAIEMDRKFPYERLSSEEDHALFLLKSEGKFRENSLLLGVVSQLFSLINQTKGKEIGLRRHYSVELGMPSFVNPNASALITQNARLITDFCETYSNENLPFIKLLRAVFGFLLNPHNPENYNKIFELNKDQPLLKSTLIALLGQRIEEGLNNYLALYEYYKSKSEKQFIDDTYELQELINKTSEDRDNHPHKLLVWIIYDFNATIEKYLDPAILKEVKDWSHKRGLTEKVLKICDWRLTIIEDLELCEWILENIENQLVEDQKNIKIEHALLFCEWHKLKTDRELRFAHRVKGIFEKVLRDYSNLKGPKHLQIEYLYWFVLTSGVIEEKHFSSLYKLFGEDFPNLPWWAEKAEKAQPILLTMLRSQNSEVARLAAVSLLFISMRRFHEHERIRSKARFKDTWIGDRYWEFAQLKEDKWHSKYIQGMALCDLKWSENSDKWLTAIKETANIEELQSAWSRVIEESGYCDTNDRDAFFKLLLQILEPGEPFTKSVRVAALRRLHEIIFEVEPQEFDERALNLPLSQRINPSF
jgi:hypothetical protein